MPNIELIPEDERPHRAKVTVSSTLDSLASPKISPLRFLRELARSENGINRYTGESVVTNLVNHERARTAFRRLLNDVRKPKITQTPFRRCQQIEVEFIDLNSATIARHLPPKLPNVIKLFEKRLKNWKENHPVSTIPIELRQSWEDLRMREAQRWQRALELHTAGYTLNDIRSELVKEFADGRGDINAWARGTNCPWLLKNIIKRPARARIFDRQQLDDVDAGYLLGALATTTRTLRTAFTMGTQDQDVAIKLKGIVKKLLSIDNEIREVVEPSGLTQFKVGFQNNDLRNIVWHASAGQQFVPWQLLATPAHERAYAQAVLDLNSGITYKSLRGKRYPVVELTFTGREQFVTEIQILFARHSITGSLSYDSRTRVSRIEFSGILTLDAIQALDFTASRKRERLVLERSLASQKQRAYTIEEYYRVTPLLAQGTPIRAIARLTGINRDAVSSWRDGQKPDSVKRDDYIQELLRKHASPERIRQLILEHGCDPVRARNFDRREAPKKAGKKPIMQSAAQTFSLKSLDFDAIRELINNHPQLSSDEQRELALQKDENPSARTKLVLHNLAMILSVINRYAPPSRRKELDLIQSCALALTHAVDHYDPHRIAERTGAPVKFSTYAYRALQTSLWLELARSNSYAMTADDSKKLRKFLAVESRLAVDGEHISDKMLMEETGFSRAKLENVRRLRTLVFASSIDAPIGTDGSSLAGHISTGTTSQTTRKNDLEEFREVATRAFNFLGFSARDQELLLHRFGFMSEELDGEKMEELSRRFKISRARVGQILDSCLETIRENINVKVVQAMILQLEPS